MTISGKCLLILISSQKATRVDDPVVTSNNFPVKWIPCQIHLGLLVRWKIKFKPSYQRENIYINLAKVLAE